jgi:hypothetical protein
MFCIAYKRDADLPASGIPHEWGLELYGELLRIGGGKERMTAYFKVQPRFRALCTAPAEYRLSSLADGCLPSRRMRDSLHVYKCRNVRTMSRFAA